MHTAWDPYNSPGKGNHIGIFSFTVDETGAHQFQMVFSFKKIEIAHPEPFSINRQAQS